MYSVRIPRVLRNRWASLFVFLLTLGAPALAQVDLQGSWRPLPRKQDGSGMVRDIAGIPVTDGDRARVRVGLRRTSTPQS